MVDDGLFDGSEDDLHIEVDGGSKDGMRVVGEMGGPIYISQQPWAMKQVKALKERTNAPGTCPIIRSCPCSLAGAARRYMRNVQNIPTDEFQYSELVHNVGVR